LFDYLVVVIFGGGVGHPRRGGLPILDLAFAIAVVALQRGWPLDDAPARSLETPAARPSGWSS